MNITPLFLAAAEPHSIPTLRLLIPYIVFVFVAFIIFICAYFRNQRMKMWHETMRTALEKGQPLPPNWAANAGRGGQSDIRRGLVLIAIGIGLFFAIEDHGRYFGLIPAFIGAALLLYALIQNSSSKKLSDADKQPPRS